LVRSDEPGRDDKFRGILDGKIERDHLACRHEHDEAGGRVRAVRHEHCDERLAVADLLVDLDRRVAREKHDAVEPAPRKLDQTHALERRPALGEHRGEDLLDQPIDAAHHRHAVEHHLPVAHDGAAEQIGGKRADHHQQENPDDEADTRHPEG
jgi:hypothetical protein